MKLVSLVVCVLVGFVTAFTSEELTDIRDSCCTAAEETAAASPSIEACAAKKMPDYLDYGPGQEEVCRASMRSCCEAQFKKKDVCVAGMKLAPSKGCSASNSETENICCEECSLGRSIGETESRKEACGSPPDGAGIGMFSFQRKQAYYQCCLDAMKEQETTTEKKLPSTTPVPVKPKATCKSDSCAHNCDDSDGVVRCSCKEGFRLQADKKSCNDINECAEAQDDLCIAEDTVCHNIPGAFKCVPIKKRDLGLSCPAGFKRNVLNQVCDDINECQLPRPPCPKYLCENTIGGYKCSGKPGKPFEELVPGNSPAPGVTDPPEAEAPKNDICPPGFRSGADDECNDIDECKENSDDCQHLSQHCINTHGGFFCQDHVSKRCAPGFKVNSATGICEDIDECEESSEVCKRSEVCVNLPGAYNCKSKISQLPRLATKNCQEGTRLKLGGKTCEDIDECREGTHLCDQFQNCINTFGAHECRCKNGFELDSSSGSCVDIDECALKLDNCVAGQRCQNVLGSFTCTRQPASPLPEYEYEYYDSDEDNATNEVIPPAPKPTTTSTTTTTTTTTTSTTTPKPTPKPRPIQPRRPYTPYRPEPTPPEDRRPVLPPKPTDPSPEDRTTPNVRPVYNPYGPGRPEDRSRPDSSPPTVPSRPDHPSRPTDPTGPDSSRPTYPSHPVYPTTPTRPDSSRPTYPSRPESSRPTQPSRPDYPTYPTQPDLSRPDSPTGPTRPDSSRPDSPTGPTRPDSSRPDSPTDPAWPDSRQPDSRRPDPSRRQPGRRPSNRRTTTELPTTTTVAPGFDPSEIHCLYGLEKDENGKCIVPRRPSSSDLSPNDLYCLDGFEKDRYGNCVESRTTPDTEYNHNELHCLIGFERDAYGNCADVNECERGQHICSSLENCVNRAGGYSCECLPGFRRADDGWCVVIPSTSSTSTSTSTSTTTSTTTEPPSPNVVDSSPEWPYQPYYPRPSSRGGRVHPASCGLGFVYDSLQEKCVDIDECAENKDTCSETEDCLNMEGGFRCVCGSRCRGENTRPSYVPAEPPRQPESGSNVITVGSQFGQRGPWSPRPTYSRTASGDILTSCPWGYKLTPEKRCYDVDECAQLRTPCGPQQRCENFYGGYSCQCPAGHKLAGHNQCADIDECMHGNPCSYNSQCMNTVGSYRCQCSDGFRNAPTNDKVCVDVDECTETPNVCEQSCANAWGGYRCYCQRGYRLASDNRTCTDVNECEEWSAMRGSRAKLCGGECVNEPGSYRCGCPSGYRLSEDQRSCVDIDECETGEATCARTSDPGQVCQNTRGSYHCHHIECPQGYRLESKHRCARIQRSCAISDWACLQQPGSYSYNFITFVSNIYIPSGSVDLFTMHGPSWSDSVVSFEMRMVRVEASRGVSPANLRCFDMRPSGNVCVISLLCSLGGPQVAELELSMSLYQRGMFAGSTVARLVVIVSEYEF